MEVLVVFSLPDCVLNIVFEFKFRLDRLPGGNTNQILKVRWYLDSRKGLGHNNCIAPFR